VTSRQQWAVVGSLPGVALAMLHSAMIDLPRADVIDALDSDRYRFHWIQGAYLVGAASGMAMTRFVAARLGLRGAYLLGLVLFSLLSAACGFASEVMWMAPPRLVQGWGMGLLISSAMVLLWRELPDRKEWAMVGYGLAVYLSAILGATLGGLLTDWHSWRLIFLINLPVGLALAALASVALPRDRPAKPQAVRFDFLGLLLLVAWIATLNVVLDMGQYWGWLTSPFFVPWLAAFVVTFGAFVVWGVAAREPLISLRPFAVRNFALGLLIKALFSINLYVLLGLLAAYMINLRGYQWWQGSLVFLPALGTMALAAAAGYRWATAENRKLRMVGGLWIMAAATLRIAAVDLYTSKVLLALEVAVWGLGAGLVLGPAMLTLFEGLALEQTATGAGLFNLMRSLPAYIAGAALTVVLTQASDFYVDILGRNMTINQPQVREALKRPAVHFSDRGSPRIASAQQAQAFLRRWVRANAAAYAYQDVLRLLAWAPLLAAGLVLFVRVPVTAAGGAAVGERQAA
jgi:DHA2 family multidrug resistance protein